MSDTSKANDEWQRIAGDTQVLVRSKIEILKLLEETIHRQMPLLASFANSEDLFVSQLRRVDAESGYIYTNYGVNRVANSAVLSADSVSFTCNHSRGTMEFLALHPVGAMLEQTPVLRFQFPDALLVMQRRVHKRVKVVPKVPLRCVADTQSALPFECQIIDVGYGGLGAIIYDNTTFLEVGMVLQHCKIVHPDGMLIEVGIEVRSCTTITLADGTTARRTGCSFIGATDEIDDLIKVFVLNMEKAKT